MDIIEKLKLVRDELNMLIDAEEKKRGYQSAVGKSFSERISGKMEKKEDWAKQDARIKEVFNGIEKIF